MHVSKESLQALREFNRWKSGAQGASFSLLDFVCCVCTPDLLLGFAELFSPELVLHDGAYFIASRFDERTYEAWKNRGTKLREIQRVMNHIHMSTLLQREEVSLNVAREAAEAVASIWTLVFRDSGLSGEVVGEEFEDLAVTLSAVNP